LATKHKAIVEKLIEMGQASAVNTRSTPGDTTLHPALQRADEAMIRLLLENGADANVANQERIWPLCLALAHESAAAPKLTRLLLEFGADSNVAGTDPDRPSSKSQPMLNLAAKEGPCNALDC
jgi:ankyrin repeat protein